LKAESESKRSRSEISSLEWWNSKKEESMSVILSSVVQRNDWTKHRNASGWWGPHGTFKKITQWLDHNKNLCRFPEVSEVTHNQRSPMAQSTKDGPNGLAMQESKVMAP
jgi:hypothetical protein